jgi:signal transduction histidine kinase
VEDEDDLDDLPIDDDDAEALALDGIFLVVRDAEGRVIAQTVDLLAPGEATDPVWRDAMRRQEPASGTASLSEDAPEYVHAVPVRTSDSPARVVEAGKSYGSVAETLSAFRTVLVLAVLAAFLLSLVGAYLLARASLSPVNAVVEAARGITDEDLSKRLPVSRRKDEIGRLATTVNSLLARLEAAFVRRDEALERQRRFVADASHELRTPLTSVVGYAQLLENLGPEDEEARGEGTAAIRRESQRMRHLVESLLALARGDQGATYYAPEPEDLSLLVREAVDDLRAANGEGPSVGCLSPGRPIEATFDKNSIRQVVDILLDNATRHTAADGKVTALAFERGAWAAVSVKDTGTGIPEDQLPLIFERFYRADEARSRGGAGLGLSIARQISEAHGGHLEVESEPGAGSRFTLLLPKGTAPDQNGSPDLSEQL